MRTSYIHIFIIGNLRDQCASATDAKSVVERIKTHVAQSVAHASLPFTAGEMTCNCITAAISTITSSNDVDEKAIDLLQRSGHSNEAKVLRRLRHVNGNNNVSGGKGNKGTGIKRKRLQMSRITVHKRVRMVAKTVQQKKKEFLMKCPFITIVIDEGNNWSRECPLYVAVIACSPEFEWRTMFIGQSNCAGKKNGASLYRLVKQIFTDTCMEEVYQKVFSCSTDGASVMRSSADHAGLDCNGTDGRAFSAFVKRDLSQDVDFWHCLCHQLNLSLNDSLDNITAVKLYYVPHARIMYSEFRRSSKRRSDLEDVMKQLRQTFDKSDWKLFYPVLFCVTRWVGIQRCVEILARTPEAFRGYCESLRSKGFGPRHFNPFKYQRHRDQCEAEEAGAEVVDGSDTSEEESDVEELHAALENDRLDTDEFQPRTQLFVSAREAARSAPSQDELVDADDHDVGDINAKGRKRKNILNKNVGYSDLNAGRSAYMAGMLIPYKILVKELQCSKLPCQHLAARRIRRFYVEMNAGWIGTDRVDPICPSEPYQTWRQRMKDCGKEDLVKLVVKECCAFASVMLISVKRRLAPTWNYIQALELVDPLGPELARHATVEVWDALRDLCIRRGIDFTKVQQQIIQERARAPDLDKTSKIHIRHNLIDYCREINYVLILYIFCSNLDQKSKLGSRKSIRKIGKCSNQNVLFN